MEGRIQGLCASRQNFLKNRGVRIECGEWPQLGRKENEKEKRSANQAG